MGLTNVGSYFCVRLPAGGYECVGGVAGAGCEAEGSDGSAQGVMVVTVRMRGAG